MTSTKKKKNGKINKIFHAIKRITKWQIYYKKDYKIAELSDKIYKSILSKEVIKCIVHLLYSSKINKMI